MNVVHLLMFCCVLVVLTVTTFGLLFEFWACYLSPVACRTQVARAMNHRRGPSPELPEAFQKLLMQLYWFSFSIHLLSLKYRALTLQCFFWTMVISSTGTSNRGLQLLSRVGVTLPERTFRYFKADFAHKYDVHLRFVEVFLLYILLLCSVFTARRLRCILNIHCNFTMYIEYTSQLC